MINILLFLLLYSMSLCVEALTFTHNDMQLNVNGYVGYRHISTTAQNSNIVSEPELGLALSLDLDNNWSMFTQFYFEESLDNALAYSFITYQNQLSKDFQVRVNAGKLRHNFGLYNDTRINPRTRQGVIMPQAIYWDSLRHLITSGEGVNVGIKWNQLELGYTIDNPIVTDPIHEAKVWSSTLLNEIHTSFGSHQLATLKYTFTTLPVVLKSSWTRIDLGNDNSYIVKYVFPGYENDNQVSQIWNNGIILTKGDWTLSAEMMILKPFFGAWFNSDKHALGVSYTAEYEINENVSVRANYNSYKTPPKKYPPQPWYTYADDSNIGVNYHRDNWMISAEVHHINGGRWVDPTDWAQNPNSYKEWWMVGLNAVYFF